MKNTTDIKYNALVKEIKAMKKSYQTELREIRLEFSDAKKNRNWKSCIQCEQAIHTMEYTIEQLSELIEFAG